MPGPLVPWLVALQYLVRPEHTLVAGQRFEIGDVLGMGHADFSVPVDDVVVTGSEPHAFTATLADPSGAGMSDILREESATFIHQVLTDSTSQGALGDELWRGLSHLESGM